VVPFPHLKLFRDLARSRNLSRAAGLNGVTPSAASQQLQELERSLGIELVDRSVRPIALTAAGQLYNELCRDVLRRDAEFMAALSALKQEVEGTVRVASIYSVGLSEMSDIESEYVRRFPGARLAVEYLRPERVYEAVLADRADIGLVSYPEPKRELSVEVWREEEMVVAVSPEHALAGRLKIQPAELNGQEFVAFDEDLPIRKEVDRYLADHGASVRVAMHFDNLQMIKEAVALGNGVSIVPSRVMAAELGSGRLKAVRLDAPLYRPLGIIYRKKKRFHPAAQGFLDLLEESIQEKSHV
jgi:LysR family transcriptional regulator, transcriptional activator of the cysJI operon